MNEALEPIVIEDQKRGEGRRRAKHRLEHRKSKFCQIKHVFSCLKLMMQRVSLLYMTEVIAKIKTKDRISTH